MVSRIMVVGELTCYALLQFVHDLKVTKINV